MKIGVLGTGTVGSTLATKLASLGHEVRMGARRDTNDKATAWAESAGAGGSHGTFADAAAFGDILFNCTAGTGALAALESARAENLAGKILIDVANPLDFSKGMPPTLFLSNDTSLGETIQRTFPEAKIVKALNTVNANVMVDPGRVPGDHDVFVCGNDGGAKGEVTRILKEWFGWKSVIDVGDITGARGTESYLLLWLRLWGALGTADFNVRVAR